MADPRGRWTMLVLLCGAVLPGMSLWFTANAVAPQLQEMWQLTASQTGWLTTLVQLGFVAGTAVAALLNLADVVPAHRYFAGCALLGAGVNALLVVAPSYAAALPMRFFTGFFLAGVYPPAMKMIATWFRDGRGLAIGAVVGALTVGKAIPYLVKAFEGATIAHVVGASSVGAAGAGLLVLATYRDGPFPFSRKPFSWGLVGEVIGHRETRLATGGYLGHMWELYAMWTWVPAFLRASFEVRQGAVSGGIVDLLAFGTLAAGGLGCVWGGWAADRIGRGKVVNRAMAISGACSLGIGMLFGASPWLLVPAALVWGFFVVADSAQFSAMVTEVAPPHAVGTALTLQTSAGFLLTMVTIQAVPWLVDTIGWRWAFALLALGPAGGILSIRRMEIRRAPRARPG